MTATTRPHTVRTTLRELCRTLAKDLLEPYRPELHYMRGPGPKSRADQSGSQSAAPVLGLAKNAA